VDIVLEAKIMGILRNPMIYELNSYPTKKGLKVIVEGPLDLPPRAPRQKTQERKKINFSRPGLPALAHDDHHALSVWICACKARLWLTKGLLNPLHPSEEPWQKTCRRPVVKEYEFPGVIRVLIIPIHVI
jgi:hypothetical protein